MLALSVPSAPIQPASAGRPGAVLVKLRSAYSLAQARAFLPNGIAVGAQIAPGSYSVQVPVGAEAQYAAKLAALPQIAYAQIDQRVSAQVQPNDPHFPEQWNLAAIGMPVAWNVITDTSKLIIAVLDTGVKTDHPDLSSQLWTNPGEIANNEIDDDHNGYIDDYAGWHFYHVASGGQSIPGQNADIRDGNGHGTHVSGIIAAAGNNGLGVTGIAWRARIMPVRVLEQDAFGWESDVIQGIDYAIANGARVINMSLGLSNPSPALAEAMARAEAHGVLVVAAAGNNGSNVLYPAAYPTVLSVGASDQSGQIAPFSSRGARLDLLAPGVAILSTWNGLPYFSRSGTSMAAPHVSGVAALLLAHRPSATPAQLRECLLFTATRAAGSERSDLTGWGILNAGRALQGCPRAIYLPVTNSG